CQQLAQGAAEPRPEDLGGAVHLLAEDRLGPIEAEPHARILCSLAWEEKEHTPLLLGPLSPGPGERRLCLRRIPAEHGAPVREGAPAGLERPRRIAQIDQIDQ